MFGLGLPELLVILVLALLVVGPKRLPQAGASIGKAIGEMRNAFDKATRGEAEAKEEGEPAPPTGDNS